MQAIRQLRAIILINFKTSSSQFKSFAIFLQHAGSHLETYDIPVFDCRHHIQAKSYINENQSDYLYTNLICEISYQKSKIAFFLYKNNAERSFVCNRCNYSIDTIITRIILPGSAERVERHRDDGSSNSFLI